MKRCRAAGDGSLVDRAVEAELPPVVGEPVAGGAAAAGGDEAVEHVALVRLEAVEESFEPLRRADDVAEQFDALGLADRDLFDAEVVEVDAEVVFGDGLVEHHPVERPAGPGDHVGHTGAQAQWFAGHGLVDEEAVDEGGDHARAFGVGDGFELLGELVSGDLAAAAGEHDEQL